MDQNQEHLKNLSEIRSLMERSSSFLSLSGLSGISAGILGLIATFLLDNKITPFLDYRKTVFLTVEHRIEIINYSLWVLIPALIFTFIFVIFFTSLKAKKKNLKLWEPSAKRLLVNLFIPLITGGIAAIILLINYYDNLILPSMLVFYGLALVNASKYTFNEIFWMGLSNILIGLTALLFPQYSLYLWGIGFGLMNIIYGTLMYLRYEK